MVKKIHYVWLGGKPLPANVRSCLRSWRKFCPDWEIVRWDENSFHVDEFRWTREALAAGKFAFAADFIRLYALSAVGGVYLDTDVEIVRPIERTLDAGFVCGVSSDTVSIS